MKKKVIFSGIQPSGNLHVGNYIGALQQWAHLQNSADETYKLIFCIVDLHAITVYQDPAVLREKIMEMTALYLACGIDPNKSTMFVQSENKDHAYLGWMLDCVTPIGWMNRMTQFKEKSEKQKESTSVGLFNYPALMAADILLYDTDLVPVGEDQKQHIELTRDIAEKFNREYGNVFHMPEPLIQKETARIMSLQNPESKMSKSAADPMGTIHILDSDDDIVKKIKRAVTDSQTNVDVSSIPDKSGVKNLIALFAAFTDKTYSDVLRDMDGLRYGDLKTKVADAAVSKLAPIREQYKKLRGETDFLISVLDAGGEESRRISSQKLEQARTAMGLGR